MGDLIAVRRRRTWLCDLTCPDKCTSHRLPEWDVEIPGYRAGPEGIVPTCIECGKVAPCPTWGIATGRLE